MGRLTARFTCAAASVTRPTTQRPPLRRQVQAVLGKAQAPNQQNDERYP